MAIPADPPPLPPLEPDPADCCGEGCANCVFDVYEARLARYQTQHAAWREQHAHDDPDHPPAWRQTVSACGLFAPVSGQCATIEPFINRDIQMTVSMYADSVPVFTQMLTALDAILGKAEAHATARHIDADALLQARLSPDMFPLTKQVQIACDFAKGVSARLAGVEVPSDPDTEQTFAELRARIGKTLAFIATLDASKFDGSAQREIVLRPGTPKERHFNGQDYLLHYGLQHFFFHVTTAYALLRHNGVEIGKTDYMGA